MVFILLGAGLGTDGRFQVVGFGTSLAETELFWNKTIIPYSVDSAEFPHRGTAPKFCRLHEQRRASSRVRASHPARGTYET